MGRDVAATQFSREDRTRYRQKVRRCLDVFERMLAQSQFDFERPMTGVEIELNLVDAPATRRMRNAEVLDAVATPDFQTELGQFNVEINVPPRTAGRRVGGSSSSRASGTRLNPPRSKANATGSHMVMVGILPTLHRASSCAATACPPTRGTRCSTSRSSPPAARTCRSTSTACERLSHAPRTRSRRRRPAPACSSTCRSARRRSPRYWNAAQAIAGVQVALGANSPFLFGRELWRETRIPLFEQATDTRSDELKAQGVRPRVWFGERWITSIFDLFEENVRYFPALLPIVRRRGPGASAASAATSRSWPS